MLWWEHRPASLHPALLLLIFNTCFSSPVHVPAFNSCSQCLNHIVWGKTLRSKPCVLPVLLLAMHLINVLWITITKLKLRVVAVLNTRELSFFFFLNPQKSWQKTLWNSCVSSERCYVKLGFLFLWYYSCQTWWWISSIWNVETIRLHPHY